MKRYGFCNRKSGAERGGRLFAALAPTAALLGSVAAYADAEAANVSTLTTRVASLRLALGVTVFLLAAVLGLLGRLLHLYFRLKTDREADRRETAREAARREARLGQKRQEAQSKEEPAAAPPPPAADAPERATQNIIDEICRSILPSPLKQSPLSETFSLAGGVQQGKREGCAFYDYFYVDDRTLCLVVGEAPGGGIAEALFAVVAQTAIRSRLHMGNSLIETMSGVNAELFDTGGGNELCVLAGLLNVMNGSFTFINAGGAMPYLMRREGGYEQLKIPVYAPLGANENVNYREEKLRFNQGDRLFLYTAGLSEVMNENEEEFGERELQAALNTTREKTRSTQEAVRFLEDESAAFCASGDGVLSYASLSLEYQKGNRDYIFTTVPGTPDSARTVTAFIRKALEDAGIDPRAGAKQILLTDELFSLCCRSCTEKADVKVECAIRSAENTISVRMFAPMGGVDPLMCAANSLGGGAAEYIRTHTKGAEFQAGIGRDMIEILSPLS